MITSIVQATDIRETPETPLEAVETESDAATSTKESSQSPAPFVGSRPYIPEIEKQY
jgi:hypothetical protein